MMPGIPSYFCSRDHMVWKKMLFEEFQEFCLVHSHLSLKKLFEGFQNGCLVFGHL